MTSLLSAEWKSHRQISILSLFFLVLILFPLKGYSALGSFRISEAKPLSDSQARITWTPSAGATYYKLRYGKVGGTGGTTLTKSIVSPYVLTGLSASTTYYVQVIAFSATESRYADVKSVGFKTLPRPTTSPTPAPTPVPTPVPSPTPPDTGTNPPPDGSTDGLIFADDFETCNLSKSNTLFRWSGPNNTAVTNSNPRNGNCSLQLTYQGSTDDRIDGMAEQRFALSQKYKELWISYDLYVPSNYVHRYPADHATNNKGFVYLWEDSYNPAYFVLGLEFWKRPNGTSYATVRHHSVTQDFHLWEVAEEPIHASDLGRWTRIYIHTRYATSGNNDGIMRVWKQAAGEAPRLLIDVRNGPFYLAGAQGFNYGYLLGWSNSGFTETTRFHIDNFRMSTRPLLP